MRKDNLWKKRIVHDVISGADPNVDPDHTKVLPMSRTK